MEWKIAILSFAFEFLASKRIATHTLIEMDAHGKERMNGFLLTISKFKLNTEGTNREAIADMKAVEEHVQ